MPELSFARRRASRPHAALVDRAAPALQLSSHLAFRPYRELFGDLPIGDHLGDQGQRRGG